VLIDLDQGIAARSGSADVLEQSGGIHHPARWFDQEVPACPDAIAEDDVAASLSGERR
jgi:hypothetical protein